MVESTELPEAVEAREAKNVMNVAGSISKMRVKLLNCALLVCGLLLSHAPGAGAGDYKLNIGDVLELSAISIPDFRYRASVGPEGDIRFPLVGSVSAQGKSIDEILKIVQDRVPTKILRRHAQDGSGYDVVIDKDEISLVIAEYNPVYLRGDVARPGSYPYRPGLTVRQALSLAGGYNVLQGRTDNSSLMTIDLRGEQDALLNQLARDRVRVKYIEDELGLTDAKPDPSASSLESGVIETLELEQLTKRRADFEKEKKHLTESAQSLSANLAILEKQMRAEAEKAKVDQEELVRVEGLVAKGMAPITRLSDTRRLLLLSASRATEVEARTEQVRQRRAEEERKLERLIDQRRIDMLRELQDTKIRLADTEAKQLSASEKMLYIGGVQSQMARGVVAVLDITLFRRTQSGSTRLSVGDDTELLPSDVLEIALRVEIDRSQASSNMPQSFSPPQTSDQVTIDQRRKLSEHLLSQGR